MASLRDVFQHAGKPVQVFTLGAMRAEGKAMQRGETVLLEPRLQPNVGDTLLFVETNVRLRVVSVEPQFHDEKIDHYRVKAEALRG